MIRLPDRRSGNSRGVGIRENDAYGDYRRVD